MAHGEPERAAYLLDEALACFAGEPFIDLATWESGALEAARLTELRLGAEEARVEALLRAGHHDDVVADALALVAARPLREHRHALLALAQYRAGRQADALATLRALRARLVDELAVEPSAGLVELERGILRQDPDLMVEAPRALQESCPWPGLGVYDITDAEDFQGREEDVAACMRILTERGVLAVVGPSGSGKSSLVRAGVAASVHASGAQVALVTPGWDLDELAATVVELPDRGVLVVDQCEEGFAVEQGAADPARFCEVLTRRAERGPVVIALRADRLADLSAHPGLARLIERGLYLLGPLDDAGLRAAIERPARQAGLVVEPGLVDLLVSDVGNDPGALPLLSHALQETWSRREGRTLTVDAYRASGGIRGSIAQSAEGVYARVPPEQRAHVRDLMLRLVSPGTQGEPSRIRVPRRRVATRPELERLVQMLVTARLVTADDGAVTLTHESLARAWPRLRGWLEDDRDGQAILHHLAASADAWHDLDRPESELYRGVRLARVQEWVRASAPTLAPVEDDFMRASVALADREERALRESERRHVAANRRLRALLAVAVVLLVVAASAGVAARRSADQASTQTARAEAAADRAEAGEVGALAQVTDDAPKSLLLAAAAARLDPAAAGALHQALARYPELLRTSYLDVESGQLTVSPDGSRLAVHDVAGGLTLLDAESLELLDRTQLGERTAGWPGTPVEFSPDGAQIASAAIPGAEAPVQLLDASTLEPIDDQLGGWPRSEMRADGVAYSADGRRIAVSLTYQQRPGPPSAFPRTERERAVLLVWDRDRPGRPLRTIPLEGPQGVQMSPDGETAYVAAPFVSYDVATGREIARNDRVYSWLFFEPSPDHSTFVAMGYAQGPPNYLLLVDAATGRIEQRLTGAGGENSVVVAWSPDGRRVAGSANDGTTVVWDAQTGLVERTLRVEDAETYGLAFSPDGATLYTSGASRQVKSWDLDGYRSHLERVHLRSEVQIDAATIRLSPDGTTFALQWGVPSKKHWVRFVDVEHDRTSVRLDVPDDRFWGAGGWSPDGDRFVAGYGEGRVRLFDVEPAREVADRRVGTSLVTETTYTADGEQVVAIHENGDLDVLDAETLAPVREPVNLGGSALHVSTNPAGRTAFVVLGGPAVQWYQHYAARSWALVDIESRSVVRTGALGLDGAEVSAFSPDGRHAMVAGRQGQLEVIDTVSGRSVVGPTSRLRGTVMSATYSPSGDQILTSSTDGSARLYDASTGAQLGIVRTPGQHLPYGGWSGPDTLVLTTRGGQTYRWHTALERALTQACAAAGRDLTQQEWRLAFPDRTYLATCA